MQFGASQFKFKAEKLGRYRHKIHALSMVASASIAYNQNSFEGDKMIWKPI